MSSSKKKLLLTVLFIYLINPLFAQLKYVIEDFEGLGLEQEEFRKEGIFSFGSAKLEVDKSHTIGYGYSGDRAIKVIWSGQKSFGGWGKGLTVHLNLNQNEDNLNFYVLAPKSNNRKDIIKISIQEDDNGNSVFDEKEDDEWITDYAIEATGEWDFVSIPLSKFRDGNEGGDGKFNIGYDRGKLLTLIITFTDENLIQSKEEWYFDFLSFSKGKLPTWTGKFSPPPMDSENQCFLGVWSEEGNEGNPLEIPNKFENTFKDKSDKKMGVVHFFIPFAIGGSKGKNLYPMPDRISWLIGKGYVPMITLEHQYVKARSNEKQPNLYSITEGHFDYLFKEWAKRLKNVQGTVLLRILHEFNGDWYPWCIAKNDYNPELYVKAFRRIHDIFAEQNVNNVKFIWCPNSTSYPQESWNEMMKAYPGDKYVDYVGMDIYNGAGQSSVPTWVSFRKEAAANYFTITQKLPSKPLLICEIASRERKNSEKGTLQNKATWIAQMSEAIKTDFSNITLLSWFNQYDRFKITSSKEAKEAYLKYILNDKYFKSGNQGFFKNDTLGKVDNK